MATRAILLGCVLGMWVAGAGCSSSGSSRSSGDAGGGAGTGGTDGCNCMKSGYAPVCGVDGKTYDAICGTQCVPVAISCNGECPCTDAGGSGGGGTGGTSSGGSGGTSTGGTAGASGGAAGDAGFDPADQVCLSKGTRAACIACCADNHAAWQMVAQATRDCVCVSPGNCKTTCAADYCAGNPGSASCYDCIFPTLASGQPCQLAAKQACGSDVDCNYYVACRTACVDTLP